MDNAGCYRRAQEAAHGDQLAALLATCIFKHVMRKLLFDLKKQLQMTTG